METTLPHFASKAPATERYTGTAIVLHWLVAAAVAGLVAWGWWMQTIPKAPPGLRADAYNLHKSFGMLVLALMAVRLAWRATHRPPALPVRSSWQTPVAALVHWALYACLVVQPLSGYLGSSFSGYPVKWFGLVLPSWAAPNSALKDLMSIVHLANSWLLVVLIAVHVLAAASHAFHRDGLLRRMWF